MSAVSFALVLLLRGDDRRSQLLGLLSDQRRVEVESELEKIGQPSFEQICQKLKKQREDERKAQQEGAETRVGISFGRISPKLAAWLCRPFRGEG